MGGSWCNKTIELDPISVGCKNYTPNDEMKARWKRKNREKQLKRTIERLKRKERILKVQEKRLRLYRARISNMRHELKESQSYLEDSMDRERWWENTYYKLLHIAHGYCSASTCGHDIEGS